MSWTHFQNLYSLGGEEMPCLTLYSLYSKSYSSKRTRGNNTAFEASLSLSSRIADMTSSYSQPCSEAEAEAGGTEHRTHAASCRPVVVAVKPFAVAAPQALVAETTNESLASFAAILDES
jgi:hypothetical protein